MLELRVLGGLTLERDGVAVESAAAQRKALAVLAVLAACGARGTTRGRLVALLWGERDEEAGRRTLAQALYQLRRTLGGDPLVDGGEPRLESAVITSDVGAFEAALARGDHAAAAAAYGGPLLDGVHVPGAPEFERWAEAERARLAASFGRVIEQVARDADARGDVAAAVACWQRAAGADPLNARVALGLVNAFAAAGDMAGAVRQGELYQALWREELRAEPDPAFAARVAELRAGQGARPTTPPVARSAAPSVAGVPAFPPDVSESSEVRGRAAPDAPHAAPPNAVPDAVPTTPAKRPRWAGRQGALAATAAVLVVAALASGARALHHPATMTPRVLVAAFDNNTGDASLDPVGRMAAGWITERLGETGLVRVVDARSALFASADTSHAGAASGGGRERLRALATSTGADVVVWGSYYRTGDSLRVEAQIADATDGHVLGAIPPVSAPAATPFAAIERAREAVTGAMATLYNPRMSGFIRQTRTPPSYEAYREAITGWDLLAARKFAESAAHMRRAFALDSTYPQPLILAANDYNDIDAPASADSMLALVRAHPERLSAADQNFADVVWSWVHGRFDTALEAAHALREHAPGPEADMLVGVSALRARRLHEAADVFAHANLDQGWMRGWANLPQYRVGVEHLLGDSPAAIAAAEAGARKFPGSLASSVPLVMAYAGAGRVDDVMRAATAAESAPDDPELTVGEVLWLGANELRAHGYPRQGDALGERSLAWFQSRPAALRATPQGRMIIAKALYRAHHWAAAESAFTALAREPMSGPPRLAIMSYLGRLAARRGDRAAALRWDDSLAAFRDPYSQYLAASTRARLAALLGDRERATTFYRQALTEGQPLWINDHCDGDFAPVRDYPPFAALLRSRD